MRACSRCCCPACRDQLYASFNPGYLVPLMLTNIRTGNCITHTISDMLLVPPTLLPTWEGWLAKAGTPPMTVPKDQRTPVYDSAPGAIEAMPAVDSEAAGTKARVLSSNSSAPAAAAPAPAKSAAAGRALASCAGLLLAAAATAVFTH